VLLIFINGLFQGFSLELWFHERLISYPKLTHEIEYNLRLFFSSILTTALYHTLFQLCGPFFVVIIKFWKNFTLKKSQFFPLKIRDFGKTMTTRIHFTFLTLVRYFHILIFEMCQGRLQWFKNFFKAGEIM